MSQAAPAQTSPTTTNENQTGSPGFFSVLLGRGTASPKSAAPAEDDAHLSKQDQPSQARQYTPGQGSQLSPNRSAHGTGPVPPRSSLARDRRYSDPRRDAPPPRMSGPAAFEAAIQKNAGSSPSRPKPKAPPGPHSQPKTSSMRPPRNDHQLDAPPARNDMVESNRDARYSRKVSFRSPAASLSSSKRGAPGSHAASSSTDSFFAPPPLPVAPYASKSKHSRSSSRPEMGERSRIIPVAPQQARQEPRMPRPRTPKARTPEARMPEARMPEARMSSDVSRRARASIQPSVVEPRRESLQAVRALGSDRVVMVPGTIYAPKDELYAEVEPQIFTTPLHLQQRQGLAPHAALPPKASKHSPHDSSRTRGRSIDIERAKSHLERRSLDVQGPTAMVINASKPRSKVDKSSSRASESARPKSEAVAVDAGRSRRSGEHTVSRASTTTRPRTEDIDGRSRPKPMSRPRPVERVPQPPRQASKAVY